VCWTFKETPRRPSFSIWYIRACLAAIAYVVGLCLSQFEPGRYLALPPF
jgi:hypothetical protein